MKQHLLNPFFHAQHIAVVGASRELGKIGHTILSNLLTGGYKGNVFPVNPNAQDILTKKCHPTLAAIPERIDLAIICVPHPFVFTVLKDAARKHVPAVIIITSGFKEIGNEQEENKLKTFLQKNHIRCIGPNCLGVFDAHTRIDSLFLPINRLARPKPGGISFISQSGALGSALIDLGAKANYGFAKFISYGNATDVNETDLLEYLAQDPQTHVICLYIEGITAGKKFMKAACHTTQQKPVIAIKGGQSSQGSKAALSHTGSLAGEARMYTGAFTQTRILEVHDLEELFTLAHIFEKCTVKPHGKRIQILTNGGGHGILTADAIAAENLLFATPTSQTQQHLKKNLPVTCTIANPLDLVGDATAERFIIAINACLADTGVDALIVNILPQTPTVNHNTLVQYLKTLQPQKPMIFVMTGGTYATTIHAQYESAGYPVFQYPKLAVKALAAYLKYNLDRD